MSIVFLIAGAFTLASINWGIWIIVLIIIYRGVYLNFKQFIDKKRTIKFVKFDAIKTTTTVIIFGLFTIMFFIFYPLFSTLLIGLSFISLSIHGGIKFE